MRVLLSDEQILVLEGLRNLLEARGIEVVGVAQSCRECIEKARELRPDIILMDIAKCTDGLSAIRCVKSEMPEVKVVVLSVSADDHALFEAVTSGASGFLLKNMHIEDLVEALDSAAHDMLPLAPGMALRLLAEFARLEEPRLSHAAQAAQRDHHPPQAAAGEDEAPGERIWEDHVLTARQREVLSLLAQGLSYKEVAGKVSLTPRTVKYHVGEIIRKLRLGNRAQVLAYAGSIGLANEPIGGGSGEPGPENPAARPHRQGHPRDTGHPR